MPSTIWRSWELLQLLLQINPQKYCGTAETTMTLKLPKRAIWMLNVTELKIGLCLFDFNVFFTCSNLYRLS